MENVLFGDIRAGWMPAIISLIIPILSFRTLREAEIGFFVEWTEQA